MANNDIGAIEKLDKSKSYKWNDKFSKILDEFRSIEICDDALVWCEEQNKLYPHASFGQIMKNFVADPNVKEGWAIMNLRVFGEMLDKKLIDGYISKMKDPSRGKRLKENPLTDERFDVW